MVLASETITYTYDELGRLIAAANSGGPRSGKATVLGFDPAGNRTGYASGVPLPAPVNAAAFVVTGPTAPIAEGTPAQFTITKSNPTSGPLSVVITTSNGSAAAPADYETASAVLTFRNWETVKYFSVMTLADTLAEGVEQFSVTLSAPSPGASITTASASASMSGGEGPNLVPVAVADAQLNVVCGDFGVRNVTGNDSDPENDLPITLVSVSGNAAASIASPSDIGFSAPYARGALYSVTYTIRDARGATATGTLALQAVGTTAQCSTPLAADPGQGAGGE